MSDTSEKAVETVKVYPHDAPLRACSFHTVELAKLNQQYTRLYDELDQIRNDIDHKEDSIRRSQIRRKELLNELKINREAIQKLLADLVL